MMNVAHEILRLLSESKLAEAEELMARGGIDRDDKPPALYLQGCIAHAKSDRRTAKVKFQRAAKGAPTNPLPLIGLGNVYVELEDYNAAMSAYRDAERLAPNDPAILCNIGVVYRLTGKLDQAKSQLEASLKGDPDNQAALFNLAGVLEKLEDFEAAIDVLKRCPQTAENLATQAIMYRRLGDAANEQAMLGQVEKLDADANVLLERRAHHALAAGDTVGFLRLSRQIEPEPRPRTALPFWDGSAAAMQRILVHFDQGLGDTVQYVRFAAALAEKALTVDVVVQPALVRLLASMPGKQRIVGSIAEARPANVYCSTLNLPGLLDIDDEAALWQGPYLSAEAFRVEKWRPRLPEAPLRIGVVWQGNRQGSIDVGRSFEAARYGALATLPGVALISLQKSDGETVVPTGLPLHVLSKFDDRSDAFLDTVAVINLLDLVITSDTSVAHIAGALGAPVWLLLQHDADKRWLQNRDDTPWYPTMRLFRQSAPGDWDGVFDRVQQAAKALLSARQLPA